MGQWICHPQSSRGDTCDTASPLLEVAHARRGHDQIERLGSIDVPTRVVCAKNDAVTPPYYSVDMAERISGAELKLFEDGGHFFFMMHADEFNAGLSELKEFILPGGSQAVASLHLARTVCRRVERALVELNDQEAINHVTCRYINRLSDLLFIISRAQAHGDGSGEVYWNSKYSRLNRGDKTE